MTDSPELRKIQRRPMTDTTGPMAADLDGLEEALANLGDEIEGYSTSENGGHVFDPKDTFIGDHLRLCDLHLVLTI